MQTKRQWIGLGFILGGAALILFAGVLLIGWGEFGGHVALFAGMGLIVLLVGAVFACGQGELASLAVNLCKVVGLTITTREPMPRIEQRNLSDEERRGREARAHAKADRLPGRDAPSFDLIEASLAFDTTPCSDQMMPMYLLDVNYRIIDWNKALSLAFDRTMEGRQGQSVLEWTYFLDNYDEVRDHGIHAFSDPNALPKIDVEEIHYTSQRYGTLVAKKRAYQLPKDDGTLLGWLVTLEPHFETRETLVRFRLDLLQLLRMDLLWTEYAMSYDHVLMNTRVYPELVDTLLGEAGDLPRLPDDARVLDLGAGSGNVTKRLVDSSQNRVVYAVEPNRAMLEALKAKCQAYLASDGRAPRVVVLKQDVSSLFGLRDKSFDYAILSNVTYAISDPMPCYRSVRRVLRRGGELRLTGPRKDTRLDRLFRRIRQDLQARGVFETYRDHYERVERINRQYLDPMLHRWTIDDVKAQLLEAGFKKISYTSDKAYAGQSMIVCAER